MDLYYRQLRKILIFCLFAGTLTHAPFPAVAQTRIGNIILKNGRTIGNVEILEERDDRILIQKSDGQKWLSLALIEKIEVMEELPAWKKPGTNPVWLNLWKTEEGSVADVQVVSEEGEQWNQVSTRFFQLHFKDSADREQILKLAALQDNVFRFLSERTRREIPYPIKVYLTPDDAGARCDFDTMSIYMTERNQLDGFLSLYMHEATHLFNKGRTQNWWSGEFMCIYHHERSSRRENGVWRFYRTAAERDTTPWNQIADIDRDKLTGELWDTRLRKAAGIYFFIEEAYGVEKLVEFWDRNCDASANANIQNVFAAVLSKDIELLQKEYQRFYKLDGYGRGLTESGRPALLEDIIAELASPEFEGRKAGGRGCDGAAEFITEFFHDYGLKPLQADNSFLQPFELPFAEFGGSSFSLANGKNYVAYEDYRPLAGDQGSLVRAPIIFIGYGISRPDYDEYAVDVTGKIVLVLEGAPDGSEFPIGAKIQEAAAHGAAGFLLIDSLEPTGELQQKFVNPLSASIPAFHIAREIGNEILSASFMNVDGAKKRIMRKRGPYTFETGVSAAMSVAVNRNPKATSSNVVGILRGEEDVEPSDYYIVCAHYDGQGKREGSGYFPGANDNASGVAALIGIAQALQRKAHALDFSVLFAAWSGEEAGSKGADYFCQNSPIPLDRVRGVLYLDMVGAGSGKMVRIQASDESHPLFISAEKAAKKLHLTIEPHTQKPSSVAFPFVQRRIPTISLTTDNRFKHTEDDIVEKMSFEALENVVDLVVQMLMNQAAPASPQDIQVARPFVPPTVAPVAPPAVPPAGSRQAVVVDYSPHALQSGRNFNGIFVGDPRCTKDFITSKLGNPVEETEHWLNYRPSFGLDFYLENHLMEIRLNHGFRGEIDSRISMASSRTDVFEVYGWPVREQVVNDFLSLDREHRELHTSGNRSLIFYRNKGLLFWFTEESIDQIVILRKR